MPDALYPPSSAETAEHRRSLAPETEKAFQAFSRQVFADGALPAKVKQIIAVAVAHVTQCPHCIRDHTKSTLLHGVTQQELMEAMICLTLAGSAPSAKTWRLNAWNAWNAFSGSGASERRCSADSAEEGG